MSHIFDALQRSEAESSGTGRAGPLEATELLKRAERRATSQWEAEVKEERHEAAVLPLQDVLPILRETAPVATIGAPMQPTAEQPAAEPDLFTKFQSLPVPFTARERLVCLKNSDSLAAEAFRLLAVRLRNLRRERPLGKLLVTSTIPQEGKSTVTANLASTLGKRHKVLLLEGDVRRPSLSHLFGLDRHPGLCHWLRGDGDLSECIYRLDGGGFWILPAGHTVGNPLELLQSGRLPALMEQLAGWFDWIVIDSPPVLPLADTSVLARLADGILLVTRQGTTKKKQLKRGLEALESRKVIGALLNSSHGTADSDYYYRLPSSSETGDGTASKQATLSIGK